MSVYTTIIDSMELLFGDSKAIQILRGWEAEFDAVIVDRDAAVNRATALEAALARSQAEAAALVSMITRVREDAADGVLDNPIPDPVPEPVAPVDPAPVV